MRAMSTPGATTSAYVCWPNKTSRPLRSLRSMRATTVFVDLSKMSAAKSNQLPFISRTSAVPNFIGNHERVLGLTLEAVLDFHDLDAVRVFYRVSCVDVEVFLGDGKEVVAVHVKDLLAARDAHHFALDLEDGLAVGKLDVETVARKGHDLFLEDERLGLVGDEALEDADLVGRCLKLNGGHGCCWNDAVSIGLGEAMPTLGGAAY
ncbi:hypothetical protein HG530_009724 [Fusarium avenaceum]|nr:hypothetical protein HG530_009724 [Fusarium avenaceum]